MYRVTCLLCLLVGVCAQATTVYKSVDAQGRVSFSDKPPEDTQLVEVLHYRGATQADPEATRARLEAMREVTDRMAADRREREASRAAVREAQQAQQQQVVTVERHYYPLVRSVGRGGYWGGPVVRPPIYRPPHHRPPHYRPPLRPPLASGQPSISSQYPAKLVRRGYSESARRAFER